MWQRADKGCPATANLDSIRYTFRFGRLGHGHPRGDRLRCLDLLGSLGRLHFKRHRPDAHGFGGRRNDPFALVLLIPMKRNLSLHYSRALVYHASNIAFFSVPDAKKRLSSFPCRNAVDFCWILYILEFLCSKRDDLIIDLVPDLIVDLTRNTNSAR